MALRKKGKHWYGDGQSDISDELRRYSSNNYPAEHFAHAACGCGGRQFLLYLSEGNGAERDCVACGDEHPIGDSAEYLGGVELDECECPCGSSVFEITVGVALYDGSDDVKWVYIGCRCPACGLTACYGDWKNEFEDFRKYLALV